MLESEGDKKAPVIRQGHRPGWKQSGRHGLTLNAADLADNSKEYPPNFFHPYF